MTQKSSTEPFCSQYAEELSMKTKILSETVISKPTCQSTAKRTGTKHRIHVKQKFEGNKIH